MLTSLLVDLEKNISAGQGLMLIYSKVNFQINSGYFMFNMQASKKNGFASQFASENQPDVPTYDELPFRTLILCYMFKYYCHFM